jgi:heme/copper-type cytochrome/quinol oxidase subunit 3
MSQIGVSAEGPVIRMRRGRSTAWWGIVGMMATEGMLFLLLFAVYLYHRGAPGPWPPSELPLPELAKSGIRSVVLLATTVPMVLAERSLKHHGRPGRTALYLLAVLGLAGWFLYGHVVEQFKLVEELRPTEHVYGAAVMTILNFHALHLIVGMIILTFLLIHVLTGRITQRRPTMLTTGGMYWHYVDAIWLVVYSLVYLSPHLLGRT